MGAVMTLHVADIMTPRVIGIDPGAAIADAAKLMLGSRISGLPVIDGVKGVVGMVSEGDFLRRSELGTERRRSRWLELLTTSDKKADEYVRARGRKIEEVMTKNVVTIAPSATLDELVRIMTSHRVKRVPVVENGKLVGIVARADLLRALLKALPSTQSTRVDDEKIRQDVTAGLAAQPWSGLIRVDVHLGVVALTGIVFDEHAREAARVLAENVAGVSSVTDQLDWVEPISGVYISASPATEV